MSDGAGAGQDESAGLRGLQGRAFGLARFVSIVLHPFAVFIALTVLSVRAMAPQAFGRALIGVSAAVIVSWLFVWQRRRAGHWTTVDASDPRERPLLYLVLLAVLALSWNWMRGPAPAMAQGIVAIAAMLIAAAALNGWIKLSLHMASLAFAAVSLYALWPMLGMAGACLLPLLGWARLRMARHTLAEVIGGATLGVAFALALRYWAG
ncbi:MAG: hypothetical protein ACREP7_06980 [Lysobacter sp.]